ncbi:MAG: class I SAM-dependent methyltransferase [Magnetococcales bacterium]|nr:class I SAM-dependent methyltransferase [Magnetococcales bacterium]MBF0321834.1 class I SAM-dependent methyltransferase [Magnetococcales bacterium]
MMADDPAAHCSCGTQILPEPGEFAAWLDRFRQDDFLAGLAILCDKPKSSLLSILDTYMNEALFYYVDVRLQMSPHHRILEIGSGIGFLSLWIELHGFDVVALEPNAGFFDLFAKIAMEVRRFAGGKREPLNVTAEQLDPETHGRFDVVFSFNVLEHIDHLEQACAAMVACLAPGGRMMHVCPNYVFPYEPHFGVPLLPGFPGITRRIFDKKISSNQELWLSLNFVTSHRIQRVANRHGLQVTFQPGLMHRFMDRVFTDELFRKRHDATPGGSMLVRILGGLRLCGLLGLLKYVPPGWATPMSFTCGNHTEP